MVEPGHKNKPGPLIIAVSDLLANFKRLEEQCQGDPARLVELLLLENHVLRLGQSSGFRRGMSMNFEEFPRFLKFEPEDRDETSSD